MKKITMLALLLIAITASSFKNSPNSTLGVETKVKLSICYYATGTIKGYSYPSKMKVYVDDELVGTSPEKDQQKKNKFSVMVPSGSHKIKCQIWAYIKGVWEERTVANDYSFDWKYEDQMSFGSKNSLKLEFSVGDTRCIRH